ncbi:hypothetical protein INR49_019483 [Caranx melampygus]|nr:hypothetical protein INR49_019483 [Caranx melampygus]
MMMMVSALLLGLVLVSVGGLWGGFKPPRCPWSPRSRCGWERMPRCSAPCWPAPVLLTTPP